MAKASDLNQNNKQYPSIYRHIRRHLSISLLVIFAVFGSTVYLAESKLEVISLHHWLDTELDRYEKEYAIYGLGTKLPNTAEFDTYWTEREMPKWLAPFQKIGFNEHLLGTEDKHFIIANHPSGKGLMYIVFKKDADDFLDIYEESLHSYIVFFGLFIALGVVIYSFYFMRLLSKPLLAIEQKISLMTPNQKMSEAETKYRETRHIEQTFINNKKDIEGFFQRETEFSRFSSHELRTPIMVIKGSSELLARIPNQPPVAQKAIKRVQQACEDMQVLSEAFLLLGKESIEEVHYKEVNLEEALKKQLNELQILFLKQGLDYSLSLDHPATIKCPPSFVFIVINNLIKNAFSYSVADIQVSLEQQHLTITNRHQGNETYQAGYGCGLVIVERVCERMGWIFTSKDTGEAFIALVKF
ncbi:two-component sensor histidine kinase [Psychromonas marina]|uniref:histidine kinase n=1 Tax=Psychromonas marina TaxID=88364 RepID=A0ABQ6DW56_9GAMM|nr:HAMP domain-containing sensor histidine kinase [Psychromonas marina]GLS89335.1 two-component sensor histidine kinase [Psychromonas marina]